MTVRILDTSVAVAWYLPENFSKTARAWRTRLLKNQVQFLVPPLHYLEFANVIRTYIKRGELEESLGMEIYEAHLEAPLEVVSISADNLLQTALEFQSTAYDAAFISLAIEHNAPLLTGERTTTPWVVKLGELSEVVR